MSGFSPTFCVDGFSDSAFITPSKSESLSNKFCTSAESSAPLGNGQGNSVMGNIPVVSLIVVLLSHGRPAAVFRAVITVIVDAVNGMFRGGAVAHISKKVLKRISPPATNGNSPAAIMMKVRAVFTVTSIFHSLPRFVFCGSMHSVSSVPFRGQFSCKTTAGFTTAITESTPYDRPFFTAITLAPEIGMIIGLAMILRENSPTTEFLAGNVDDWSAHKDSTRLRYDHGDINVC